MRVFTAYVVFLTTYFSDILATEDVSSIKSFTIDYKKNCFLKDKKPFRYISGSVHYFRVPRANWDDRLKKAKACGLNAIQTYVAWNIHEPKPGVYDFDGEEDLVHFIKLCHKNGLLVILRPGPYIDAEWENGGFPWWLTKNVKEFRTSRDLNYMYYVNRWFRELFGRLKPLLYKYSGPIITVQVENEYGNYYACDRRYIQQLKSMFEKYLGDNVVLFTTDGHGWTCGSLPSLFTTIDFGVETDPEHGFNIMRKYQPNGPLVNSEFYTGWQDFWGYPHSRTDKDKIAKRLDKMLAMNASVNLYMFHGGTNFGFMNGNDIYNGEGFVMAPTTYDYNAPLSEAGDPTDKYFVLRNVIQKYTKEPLPPVPVASAKIAYGKVFMESSSTLQEFLSLSYPHKDPYHSKNGPLTMETIDQAYGFIVYRTRIPNELQSRTLLRLQIDQIHDRSIVFVDGKREIVAKRGSINLPIQGGTILDIFVENQGRLCYGSRGMKYYPDPKGIIGSVKINSFGIKDWDMYSLNSSHFALLGNQDKFQTKNDRDEFQKTEKRIDDRQHNTQMFFIGSFMVNKVADTFIDMKGWSKGQVIINSFNVGRYWQLEKGPQRTLYVPSTALHVGKNNVMIIELDSAPCSVTAQCSVEFVDKPILI